MPDNQRVSADPTATVEFPPPAAYYSGDGDSVVPDPNKIPFVTYKGFRVLCPRCNGVIDLNFSIVSVGVVGAVPEDS